VDASVALLTGRLVYFAILAVAALWILNIFGNGITPLLTVLGAVGLAVSLALQDVLRNLFAGFYMLIERPFMIGDLIEVKGVNGTVQSIELRLTVLATLDGLRVTVPNATVFTEVLINRSAQPYHRWPVLVTAPPTVTDLGQIERAVGRAAQVAMEGAPPPLIAVQAASAKGTLVQVGLWAPDAPALGQAMLALRAALPGAIVTVPGAHALPDSLPAPTPRRRISRTRPLRVARTVPERAP
jgi:small-conductance mechanosensitive channel